MPEVDILKPIFGSKDQDELIDFSIPVTHEKLTDLMATCLQVDWDKFSELEKGIDPWTLITPEVFWTIISN